MVVGLCAVSGTLGVSPCCGEVWIDWVTSIAPIARWTSAGVWANAGVASEAAARRVSAVVAAARAGLCGIGKSPVPCGRKWVEGLAVVSRYPTEWGQSSENRQPSLQDAADDISGGRVPPAATLRSLRWRQDRVRS